MLKKNYLEIVIFLLTALGSGWLGLLVDVLYGEEDKPGMMIWLGLPFLIMLILRSLRRKGWRDPGFHLSVKGSGSIYRQSLLLFPVFTVVVILLGRLAGFLNFYCPFLNNKPGFFKTMTMLIISGFVKNIFEESVWRGFLTSRFSEFGLSRLINHLLTGLFWGLWHLPYLGFVLSYYDDYSMSLLPLFLAGTIAFSMIAGEIRMRTGSILPSILLHTTAGVCVGLVYSEISIVEFKQLQWLFSPGIEGLIMIILMFAAGILMIKFNLSSRVKSRK